jgi:lipid II:glycine glycyltransferase (peptidoglycan interpeptide bridge formation enzyme)
MSAVQPFTEDHHSWDRVVTSLQHANIFASHAWSTIQERSGWITHRFVAADRSFAFQLFAKNVSRLCSVCWVPGGILGSGFALDGQLARTLHSYFDSWGSYLRISFPYEVGDSLPQDGSWQPAESSLSAKQSVVIDLQQSPETLIQAMGPNWRRNLKRSQRTAFVVRELEDGDLYAVDLLEEGTARQKALKLNPTRRASDVIRSLGDSAVVIGVFDTSGQLVSVRGASLTAREARDLVSATSTKGRRQYASYRATWDLINVLRQRQIQTYDLAGFDPETNPGVADFKRGTGGVVVVYGGEFVHSKPTLLRSPMDIVLKVRSA